MSLDQLARLIDLPDSDLAQVLEYASTLSKPDAVDHFNNLLGASPQAIEFIAAFNSRRRDPTTTTSTATSTPAAATPSSSAPASEDPDSVPKPARKKRDRKKAPLHALPPRQAFATNASGSGVAYSKKGQQDDYLPAKPVAAAAPAPTPKQRPAARQTSSPAPPRLPPSAAGSLTSDLLAPSSSRQKSSSSSRPKSAATTTTTTTKVSITGGTAMRGASTALDDLDAAIRALEITTNPQQTGADPSARRCNCVAARHPLSSAAPNCLSCGKVVCAKEGLGPCTFCGSPLLSPAEVQAMIKELRADRGRERMAADRSAHRRADVSAAASHPFTRAVQLGDSLSPAEARAREHRDKLLNYQAQNAQRTTVRDEASDFDVGHAVGGSGSIWASPEERARELKRQQKTLREMEWNARPEYEKRRQVVSIDLVGGKVVRKMAAAQRPASPEVEDDVVASEDTEYQNGSEIAKGSTTGTFSENPLLGGLIKPKFVPAQSDGEVKQGRPEKSRWQRVQDI